MPKTTKNHKKKRRGNQSALQFVNGLSKIKIASIRVITKNKDMKIKQERKLTSASRSLYTLAAIIIKFKNTKNDIPNSIR